MNFFENFEIKKKIEIFEIHIVNLPEKFRCYFPVGKSSTRECVITAEVLLRQRVLLQQCYYDLIPTPRKAIEECQMPIIQ